MIAETTRKMKLLYVDPSQFMSIFKEGMKFREGFEIVAGIPDDAQVLGVTYEPSVHGILIVVSSESYEDIPHGKALPMVQVDIKLS